MAEIDSVDLLCKKIDEEADKEVKGILDLAAEKKSGKLKDAERESVRIRDAIVLKTRERAESEKRKILSTLNLEIKRIALRAKEDIVDDVFGKIISAKKRFPEKEKEYKEFLKNAIIEACLELEMNDLVVVSNGKSHDLIALDEFKEVIKAETGKDIIFVTGKDNAIDDIGVIVKSKDGRVFFDNTFSSRFERLKTDLRSMIFRDLFG